ncbi:macrophage mannose receptor 1-like [Hoplias malabaricus]|uniref:macrophage mannose receptor 1-like n=1 Tax=Hoplias malabaricus TaxID=27720 RepID=UPI003461DA30
MDSDLEVLILVPAASHSVANWTSRLKESNKTTSSAASRHRVLRPPNQTPSVTWLRRDPREGKELVLCSTESALFLLDPRFNYQSDSLLQYPRIDLTGEAEGCDPPIVGTHLPICLLKKGNLQSASPEALPPMSMRYCKDVSARTAHNIQSLEKPGANFIHPRGIYSAPVGVYNITMATTLTFLLLLLLLSGFSPADQSRLRTFHLIEKKMIQSEARAACRTNYTDLVTVYSEEDNAALSDLTKTSNDTPWIGLYRSQPRAKWSNGDNVTFSDLKGDCGTGPCCAAVKADGSWESLKCTENRTFMCYKQDATDLTFSYSLVLESLTWYEAQSHCRENYTDLVSIRDQTQNEEVKKEGRYSSGSFWIGLLTDDWEWSDGGRSAYRNWGTYQPRAPSSTSNSYIHVSAEPMNWESALDYCSKENRSSVLRIESDLDQKEVERELRRRGVSGTLWLGLGQSRLFGFWIWTNGISVGPFSNWVGGRAPEAPLSQNCGAIDTEKGFKWRDRDCRSKYRVLCEEN